MAVVVPDGVRVETYRNVAGTSSRADVGGHRFEWGQKRHGTASTEAPWFHVDGQPVDQPELERRLREAQERS